MASTLNDVQTDIAVDFDSSATPPATTNSEWSRRTALINRAERMVGKALSWRWPWLYKTDSSLATVVGTATISLPGDFRPTGLILDAAGNLHIGSTAYRLVTVRERQDFDTTAKICWITGNDVNGYTLHVQPTPTAVATLDLQYYSFYLATDQAGTTEKEVMTDSTDKTKIPAAVYLSLYTLAQLYKDDDEGNKGIDFERQAIDELNRMLSEVNNEAQNYHAEIPDIAERDGYPMIGA